MTEATPPAAPTTAVPAPQAKPAAPTEFPPPVKKTVEWLNDMFAEWYRRNPPPMPDRFTRREFGYILWPERPGTPPFIRHKAYDNSDRFHWYLQKAGPHSVYYSTAYYRRPGEMKMLDKQWLGAELIFDLDADHLKEAEDAKKAGREMPLSDQLGIVKTQFKRLLDEFLFGDFGLGEDDVWITFSGGRGYHAHVVEESLLKLGSRERREIVDYVTGKFPADRESRPNFSHLLRKKATRVQTFQGRVTKIDSRVEVPPITEPGWGGRLTRGVLRLLDENITSDVHASKKWLMSFDGIGEKRANDFLRKYTDDVRSRLKEARKKHWGMMEESGDSEYDLGLLDADGSAISRFYELALSEYALPMEKGETDEPVTADTKRLIRLPGSLHGKSGLKVVTLRRDDLDAFEPLRDAVAFPMEPTRIVPRNDATMTLGGETVSVKKGEPQDVPLPHAVFWLARQGGTIVVR